MSLTGCPNDGSCWLNHYLSSFMPFPHASCRWPNLSHQGQQGLNTYFTEKTEDALQQGRFNQGFAVLPSCCMAEWKGETGSVENFADTAVILSAIN